MSYTRNGYKMIYMPEHHRAIGKMVYEHIYLVEQYIGRQLRDGEEVHHRDENRLNNSEDNLIVFKTKGDHSRYHRTGIMIQLEDGTYVSPIDNQKCIVCNCEYYNPSSDKYCSKDCQYIGQRRVKRPTKEELEEMIKSKSFTEIGRNFEVSDNAVRKWCKSYGLPYRKKDFK